MCYILSGEIMNNLYWSIYKNLENELLSLTYQIHFDDNQLKIYSTKFVDLLLRISIEIESISKDLYKKNGGELNLLDRLGNVRDLFFDTDCLNYLNNIWNICDKEVSIIALNTFFSKKENITIKPLLDANKRGKNIWKKAYQAVKHNREENLKQANLKNCIWALASLFILNLYYLDDKNLLNEQNCSSLLFSPKRSYVVFEEPTGKYDISVYNSCVILEIYNNKIYNEICKSRLEENKKLMEILITSNEFHNYKKQNPILHFENMNIYEMFLKVGGQEFAREKFSLVEHKPERLHINSKKFPVLNKNQKIYTLE